jgi:hypothetical protein
MIHEVTREKLFELRVLLENLSDNQLTLPLDVLNGSTMGMHLRHILEFYQCLFTSLADGNLNYDLRKRDREMERNKKHCLSCIETLLTKLEEAQVDQPICLTADYSLDTEGRKITIGTTFFRELLYNVEHCVHHLAIIKIGIRELDPMMMVDKNLGVAASTIRNNNLCAR